VEGNDAAWYHPIRFTQSRQAAKKDGKGKTLGAFAPLREILRG
jgi:hypothetical protein